MNNSPFAIIKRKQIRSAIGVGPLETQKNRQAARANSNILMRARTMADYGINVNKWQEPLEKYKAKVLKPFSLWR